MTGRYLGKLKSLVEGDTPADRRVLSGVIVDSPTPTSGDLGFPTFNRRYLFVEVALRDFAAEIEVYLWVRTNTAGEWSRYQLAEVMEQTNSGHMLWRVDLHGIDRVFLEITNVTFGAGGAPPVIGADAWMSVSTF